MAGSIDPTNRWEQMWSRGVGVGDFFDASKSSPALHSAIEKGWFKDGPGGELLAPALIPGCGRGYDVATLADAVGSATGLELSTTAQKTATEYLVSRGLPADKAEVINGDFFKATPATVGKTFGSAFDYTMFCAIPPASRQDWADAYARLIKPGGVLVCLQFPLDSTGRSEAELVAESGPPFPVVPAQYDAVLTAAGFERLAHEAVPVEHSHPGRGGREALALYRRVDSATPPAPAQATAATS